MNMGFWIGIALMAGIGFMIYDKVRFSIQQRRR